MSPDQNCSLSSLSVNLPFSTPGSAPVIREQIQADRVQGVDYRWGNEVPTALFLWRDYVLVAV